VGAENQNKECNMRIPKKQKSPMLTESLAAYIKWLWQNTPLNQAQIAAMLGALNQGRVSEVVNGHRYADVKPKEFVGWS
jgi:predicted XRE-type DNA-binding protein